MAMLPDHFRHCSKADTATLTFAGLADGQDQGHVLRAGRRLVQGRIMRALECPALIQRAAYVNQDCWVSQTTPFPPNAPEAFLVASAGSRHPTAAPFPRRAGPGAGLQGTHRLGP